MGASDFVVMFANNQPDLPNEEVKQAYLRGELDMLPNEVVYKMFCMDDPQTLPFVIRLQMMAHLHDIENKEE